MSEEVQLLLLGFVLTSVVGGGLGSLFQRRAWNHQHETQRREEERRQALKTFEEISSLLDRRIHRTRVLYQQLKNWLAAGADSPSPSRTEYRLVLDDWNDNLNRMLALTQTYFGSDARGWLEDLQEDYAAIGRAIDNVLRYWSPGRQDPLPVPRLGHRLKRLSDRVYAWNVAALGLLQSENLGGGSSDPTAHRTTYPPELGDIGPAVRVLQRRLADCRRDLEVVVDGIFGVDTYRAVCKLQSTGGLAADGIPGPRTMALLSGEPLSSES